METQEVADAFGHWQQLDGAVQRQKQADYDWLARDLEDRLRVEVPLLGLNVLRSDTAGLVNLLGELFVVACEVQVNRRLFQLSLTISKQSLLYNRVLPAATAGMIGAELGRAVVAWREG